MGVTVMLRRIRQHPAGVRSVDVVMRFMGMLHELGMRMPVSERQCRCHNRHAQASARRDE